MLRYKFVRSSHLTNDHRYHHEKDETMGAAVRRANVLNEEQHPKKWSMEKTKRFAATVLKAV